MTRSFLNRRSQVRFLSGAPTRSSRKPKKSQLLPWGEYGLNQAFKRAQKRAGRGGASFHDLRHFFITELFRKGVSVPVVQQLAGHADLATTQRYADMVASDLTAAIAAFSLPGRIGAEGV